MSALEKLKNLLGSSTQIQLPSISQFLPLNIKKIKETLRLEEKAKENGSKQLPRSGSEDFDDVESEIINIIEGERARCLNEFNDHLATYNQRLANLNIEARLTKVTLAAKEAISDFKEQIHQGQDDLTNARDDVKLQADHFETFKLENNLKRPARPPNSTIFYWVVVLGLFIVEAGLNASFLAVGNAMGFLGGFGEAVGIAFLNVGLALFFGIWIVPWLWHKSIGLKLMGSLLMTILIVFNVSLNIFLAHYRDALAGDTPEQAANMAVTTVLASPLDISSFTSWVMVGVGCFFALIALIESFKMDDPYPLYGYWDRLRRRTYETYAYKKARLLNDLKDTRDDASSTLAELKDDLIKRRQEHDSIIANRQNLLVHFETHQNYLENCGRELITFYRAKNQGERNTPPPKYFDRAWHLERKASPVLPTTSLSDEHLNNIMTEASSTIQSAISEVMDAFDQAISKIDQISEIIKPKEADRVTA